MEKSVASVAWKNVYSSIVVVKNDFFFSIWEILNESIIIFIKNLYRINFLSYIFCETILNEAVRI